MANPRQRRKARSSSYRPAARSATRKNNIKWMPPIRGPKVLQDNWDRRKTVRQNYAAMGLAFSLSPTSCGGDGHQTEVRDSGISPEEVGAVEPSNDSTSKIPSGYGRIIRDAEGNVLSVEFSEEDKAALINDAGDRDMEQMAAKMDEGLVSRWVGGEDGSDRVHDQDIIKELQRVSVCSSSMSGRSRTRHASQLEKAYLERLVRTYGSDVERMSRDRRLNPEQRTIGELRRGLKGLEWEV